MPGSGAWRRAAPLAHYGWYALNVLELPPHLIALQLGNQDGGRLVHELYGHPFCDLRSVL